MNTELDMNTVLASLGLRYGLMNRPAGIGCLPRGLAYELAERPARGQLHHEMARHGVIHAGRPLTQGEILNFELAVLVEGRAATEVVARLVAEPMREYAAQYLECRMESPDEFNQHVMGMLDGVMGGLRLSIADPALLGALVEDQLQPATEEQG